MKFLDSITDLEWVRLNNYVTLRSIKFLNENLLAMPRIQSKECGEKTFDFYFMTIAYKYKIKAHIRITKVIIIIIYFVRTEKSY